MYGYYRCYCHHHHCCCRLTWAPMPQVIVQPVIVKTAATVRDRQTIHALAGK